MITAAKPLRVVHVSSCLEVGGQEKLLVEFARHADRRRVELHFVSLGTRGPVADELEAEGWPVTALDVPPGLFPGLVIRLARMFRRLGADAVHTHNERPLIYAAPAARLARVPRVIHTKHGRGFTNSPRQTRVANLAARFVDEFVCVSRDSARLSVEQGLSEHRLRPLWNGIDTERFAYTGPRAGGPAVLVARLSPEKDVATLLRAAALAAREEPRFRLEIAGDGPCMDELQALARELGLVPLRERCCSSPGASLRAPGVSPPEPPGLEDSSWGLQGPSVDSAPWEIVRFLGMVRDVPAVLARAGLFVLSSLTEGVSLTLLEAMARGLPVVATKVGGNPEVVVDGETGLLVPSRDPEALAAAMLRVFRDPSSAREMGRRGRERVEAHFEIRAMVAAYERMYAGERRPDEGTSHAALDDGRPGRAGRGRGGRALLAAAPARD